MTCVNICSARNKQSDFVIDLCLYVSLIEGQMMKLFYRILPYEIAPPVIIEGKTGLLQWFGSCLPKMFGSYSDRDR